MSLPDTFNSVADLLAFTSFQQGPPNGQDSVAEGTFAFSQFQTALRHARNEIYRKTGKGNDEFTEDRYAELEEAELWLATSRLYPRFGERIVLKFPESNLAGVASVTIGADTPSPVEKGQHWAEFMYKRLRAIGLELLESPSTRFAVEVGTLPATDPFPCLSDAYAGDSTCFTE